MKLSFQAERDPKINSLMFEKSGNVMVLSSVMEGIIVDDDLAQVPEVMPFFFKLAGELRDDVYRHHGEMKKPIQFPIISNCFCYCFAKGAEAAFLWKASPNGKIAFSYDPEGAIAGNSGPDPALSDEFVTDVGFSMDLVANVFVDFQNDVWVNPKYGFTDDARLSADVMACGLYWAAAIGLDFGMNRLGFK